MALLADYDWKRKYTPDDGNLASQFYLPALRAAVRYDRTTGYFSASALTLAARGIESLVRNEGRMRMIVGCTLDIAEAEAIQRGESLRETVAGRLMRMPLLPAHPDEAAALELLSWMVAKGFLEVRLAVPCDTTRKPVAGVALFHEKAGIVEDKTGDRLAFCGSVNETAGGWLQNWESFHVFCSWRQEHSHIAEEELTFTRLWANESPRALVLDVGDAIAKSLLSFLPDGEPARLMNAVADLDGPGKPEPVTEHESLAVVDEAEHQRDQVWSAIWGIPAQPSGIRVGEATSAVTPWPHQVLAFHRLYDRWPPKLLIADEVGLGKTVEAGLLLRQAWLSGRAKRILVLAPKSVLMQWQAELREKFNLHWPVYNGSELVWPVSPVWRDRQPQPVSRADWHRQPCVLASSHLMRRRERQPELLDAAEPWDLVIVDEAHHARRKNPGAPGEGGPNLLLRLLQGLRLRTQGLVLLTATPMQVHPVEVWDLLSLLGMPPEWSAQAFVGFFEKAASNPSASDFEQLAALFQAAERAFGPIPDARVLRLSENSRIRANRVVRALRDAASIPRRQLDAADRALAIKLMKSHTPVAALVSRHTRELLRQYYRRGQITSRIAERRVVDRFLQMTPAERVVYEAVEDYISTTYNNASEDERTSVGFVMTIYRRRLASSFAALKATLESRVQSMTGAAATLSHLEEDADDEIEVDGDDAERNAKNALNAEETSDIQRLLAMISKLPTDTKTLALLSVLSELEQQGYRQCIVFTQYTDTLDALRALLIGEGRKVMCFTGRGGERMDTSGDWRRMSREETKRRFRAGEADLLLCTDAAAEGLNFQFCGALVNFDMPWNPMRVEQRIGRVDRLGQQFEEVAIANLLYEDTVEADVYRALSTRIGLFTQFVGRLQPILSSLPQRITAATLAGSGNREQARAQALSSLIEDVEARDESGFDLDESTIDALEVPPRQPAAYDLDVLKQVLAKPLLLPKGVVANQVAAEQFHWQEPGRAAVRVTTDPDFYEENSDNVELWSPGNPLFPGAPVSPQGTESPGVGATLVELLNR